MIKKTACILMTVCLFLMMTACGSSSQQEASVSDVPKSEQTGTAGSNIPLKDNTEEAEKQIMIAMQDLLD